MGYKEEMNEWAHTNFVQKQLNSLFTHNLSDDDRMTYMYMHMSLAIAVSKEYDKMQLKRNKLVMCKL